MSAHTVVSADVLRVDPARETERIASRIRDIVFQQLKRKGIVVAVSGGIDSSVVAFLCARAIGKERVLVLFMPALLYVGPPLICAKSSCEGTAARCSEILRVVLRQAVAGGRTATVASGSNAVALP